MTDDDDWALIEKPDGIPIGKIAMIRPDPGEDVWIVGYPGSTDRRLVETGEDRREKRAYRGIVGEFPREFEVGNTLFLCLPDVELHGMSGGAVLLKRDGEMVAVATLVGRRNFQIKFTMWGLIPVRHEFLVVAARLITPEMFGEESPEVIADESAVGTGDESAAAADSH